MNKYPFQNRKNSSTANTPSAGNKKETEEQRKKQDEQAAAQAFEEYVACFQDSAASKPASKVWIKAGTYDAGRRQEDTKEKGKLYKPTSRFIENMPDRETNFNIEEKQDRSALGKKKTQQEKKKSNLEIFKEELKIIQEEREERHRLKKMLGLQEVIKLPPKPGDELRASLSLELDDVKMGSIDDGDPNTTNIYLGNLPTKISEQQLMEIFGKFGPLASVKVMWPRTDEEKARNRLSGFVAYMCRRDGERALKHLAGKEILNAEVKLGWGKAVPIPPFPIFIPPNMMELTMPPPPSGLPFNAQPGERGRSRLPPPGTPYPTHDSKAREEFDKVVSNATVKVVIPTDRTLLSLIHRMIEFVAREGPMFEAMIMNREISNTSYRFLFENQSPAHIYYRWKLYSILQGDSTQRWRTEDFRMFKNGSIWRPPNLNPFTQGMPDELIPEDEREIRKGTLSNAQRTRLERMLRNITPDRHRIAEIMIFSIEHSEAISEICECIKESLANPKTTLQKKIARLYIISDVLHNSGVKGMSASGYRKGFKIHLPAIFQEIHYAFQTASSEGVGSTAECFKERVLACCRAWDEWGIYPSEFLIRLQNIFLGLLTANSREEEEKIFEGVNNEEDEEEIMKKRRKSPPRAQLPPKSALNLVRSLQSANDDDIDGIPISDEVMAIKPQSPVAVENNKSKKGGFVPSKWETIDPEEVKAGAVTTTSKWDLFEDNEAEAEVDDDKDDEEDIDGIPMEEDSSDPEPNSVDVDLTDEKRRIYLREVELKVAAYEDELERLGIQQSAGVSVSTLVEEYRRSLISGEFYPKEQEESQSEESPRISSSSRSKRHNRSRSRSRKRSRSSSSSRSNKKNRRSPPRRDSPRSRSSKESKHRDRDRERSSRRRSRSVEEEEERSTSRDSRRHHKHKHEKHKR